MEKYINYKNILLMMLGLLVCLGVKVALDLGKLPQAYQNYQKNSAQLQQLAQADQIIGELAMKTAELQKQIGVSDYVQSPIHKHLDFVKYLEVLSREKKAQIITLPEKKK